MKKLALSTFVIITFFIYSLFEKMQSQETLTAPTTVNISQSTQSNLPSPPSTNPLVKSLYKNGTYTGNIADAYYGNVQVKVVISAGKITDVQFLDYPQDRRTSQNINSQAMPYLKTEAIQAQNAQVDIVSGATQTSRAFIESLGSALNQAKS